VPWLKPAGKSAQEGTLDCPPRARAGNEKKSRNVENAGQRAAGFFPRLGERLQRAQVPSRGTKGRQEAGLR
jgi:hypothetical protein